MGAYIYSISQWTFRECGIENVRCEKKIKRKKKFEKLWEKCARCNKFWYFLQRHVGSKKFTKFLLLCLTFQQRPFHHSSSFSIVDAHCIFNLLSHIIFHHLWKKNKLSYEWSSLCDLSTIWPCNSLNPIDDRWREL